MSIQTAQNAFSGTTVVVTGGAGAIGSYLTRSLCLGGAKVIVIDDFSSGSPANLIGAQAPLELIEGDLADEAVLERAFSHDPTYVFHLAAFFANQNSVEFPERDLHINGLATLRLLQRAAASRVERLVYTSSSCVYGAQDGVLCEETDLRQDTPYAITKLLGEQYLHFFREHEGLSATVLRFFNSYGPGDPPGRYRSVIPNFFDRAIRGLPLKVTGTGQETRDFTYVEDVVRGTLLAAMSREVKGATLNIGTGTETRILDLAESINRLVGNRAGITLSARRSWDTVTRRVAGTRRAKQVLGFRPEIDLEQGLERTYKWFIGKNFRPSGTAKAAAPQEHLLNSG